MRFASLSLLVVVSSALAVAAHADTLAYSNAGHAAPTVVLTAAASGPIVGYFVGANAGDTDTVALRDLTTGVTSAYFFNNQSTAAGTSVNFGTVTAGDVLQFVLNDASTKTTLYSDASNADGIAHAYITNYAGGTINNITYPAGVYVGFEDRLTSQNSDLDYNDDTFIFTNVASRVAPTPEPGSLALLGTGGLSAAGVLRRRLKA